MKTPTDHLSPILRLPPHVRHRIYLHTNVVPDAQSTDEFHMPHYHDALHLYSHTNDFHGRNKNSRYRGFSGLLRSCRVIYNEVSTLLYSSNDFFIRYRDQGSLEPLWNLTSHSISKVKLLKIILNEASCPTGYGGGPKSRMTKWDHEACPIGIGYGGGRIPWSLEIHDPELTKLDSEGCIEGRDRPLESGSPVAEAILSQWHATIDHLSTRITPKTLELLLVCDVDPKDIELARRVVGPLTRLPLLKNCHLRLSRIRTSTLNDLTRSTVIQVRGIAHGPDGICSQLGYDISGPSSPASVLGSRSRLTALPRELRFRILEFTDLITPWKEVTWSRQYRGFIASRAFCLPLDARGREECPLFVHHGCQFDKCWDTYPDPPLGCFCRVKHSAFSSGCKCWEPPQNLFLVCRSLYNDCQVIFYSGNRFVIHDVNSHPPWEVTSKTQTYPFSRLAASVFLTEIVPKHCLRELRSIEFVFPPYHAECWPQEGQAALQDWVQTIEWLKKRLTLPALTGEEILAAYARILAPLAELGSDGLAKFHAHLNWPWTGTWETDRIISTYGWEWIETKEKELNDQAEQSVMGNRYNSLLEGDDEPMESLWMRTWSRHE